MSLAFLELAILQASVIS